MVVPVVATRVTLDWSYIKSAKYLDLTISDTHCSVVKINTTWLMKSPLMCGIIATAGHVSFAARLWRESRLDGKWQWLRYLWKTPAGCLGKMMLKMFLGSDNGMIAGIIMCMDSANERRRYYVTPSLIGRAHTQNDPWMCKLKRRCVKYTGLILVALNLYQVIKNIIQKYYTKILQTFSHAFYQKNMYVFWLKLIDV